MKSLHPGHWFLPISLKKKVVIILKSQFKSQYDAVRSVRLNCVKSSWWSEVWSHFSDSAVRECTRFHKALRSAFPALSSTFEMRLHVNGRDGPKAASSVFRDESETSDSRALDLWLFRPTMNTICHRISKKKHSDQDVTEMHSIEIYTPEPLQHSHLDIVPVSETVLRTYLHSWSCSPQKMLLPPPVFTLFLHLFMLHLPYFHSTWCSFIKNSC